MEQLIKQICPECGVSEYQFRGRKNISAEDGKPACTVTKYKCKKCGHVWSVHVEAKPTKGKPCG